MTPIARVTFIILGAIVFAIWLTSLSGCASVKPYVVCKVADGKAQVQQGVMGIGVGQELPDADPLCAGVRK